MVISDLTVDDTGQYVCLMDNEYEAVHIVEVALKEPTRRVSKTTESKPAQNTPNNAFLLSPMHNR